MWSQTIRALRGRGAHVARRRVDDAAAAPAGCCDRRPRSSRAAPGASTAAPAGFGAGAAPAPRPSPPRAWPRARASVEASGASAAAAASSARLGGGTARGAASAPPRRPAPPPPSSRRRRGAASAPRPRPAPRPLLRGSARALRLLGGAGVATPPRQRRGRADAPAAQPARRAPRRRPTRARTSAVSFVGHQPDPPRAGVAAVGARQRELAELVADHRLADEDRHVLAAVVDGDRVADHLGEDRRGARPGLDHLLGVGGVHRLDARHQPLLDERALLARAAHRLPFPRRRPRTIVAVGELAASCACGSRASACPTASPGGDRRWSGPRRRRAGGRPGSSRRRGSAGARPCGACGRPCRP